MAPRQERSAATEKGPHPALSKVIGSRTAKRKKQRDTPGNLSIEEDSDVSTASPNVTKTEEAQDLLNGGYMIAGDGSYQQNFRKLNLQKHSDFFLKGKNKIVPSEPEYREKLKKDAEDYLVLTESTTVECNDGEPLLYFIKGGMTAGMTAEEGTRMRNQTLQAINNLLEVYPPPLPKANNSRHPEGCEAELKSWKAKGMPWGVFTFAYWHEQGGTQKPAKVSSDACPGSEIQQAAVKAYMELTAWEHHQVGAWMKALQPKAFEEQDTLYQNLRTSGKLEHLDQGPKGCHAALALLVNVGVNAHKDRYDVKDGWTEVNCEGQFTGGDQVFPDLRIKIQLEPGDLVLAHYAVLEHWVENIVEGQRYCHVRFTKRDILRPHNPKFHCRLEGCHSAFSEERNLKDHLRGNAKKLHHGLPLEEVKNLVKAWRALKAQEELPREDVAKDEAGVIQSVMCNWIPTRSTAAKKESAIRAVPCEDID